MTVFIVTCGSFPSDWWIVGVFSSRALAEQAAEKSNLAMRAERTWEQNLNYANIDEYNLDVIR